ncbi:MAG: hypothetical protein L3J41_03950 [Melioribacteraceae bacterium]|nr:hypothetical protein [Melioribacteraceae bacterium]
MKYLLLQIILFLLTSISVFPQNKINSKYLYSDYALKSSRDNFKSELDARIETTFSLQLNSKTEKAWSSLFREVGLQLYKSDKVRKAVKVAAEYAPMGSVKFQRAIVEAIIILYPTEFKESIDSLYAATQDPTLYSYLIHYYSIQNSFNKSEYITEMKIRFPNWNKVPQLNYLIYYLEQDSLSAPPLKDILSHKFIEGKTIIYSLYRKDRSYPGITIIKKPNGEFVKSENDSIFYVQQLALSVSNLPGYLSQGNTPQGIFSIVGFYNSPTPSIGPTAAVLTRIPYEVPIKLWYHNTVSKSYWDIKDYKNLLPESWQEYLPIYESYYAGKTGRRKIVMHGSVDDLSFYDKLPYAPLTPSKGCLTTIEIWNDSTGENIRSDQAKLMNAFFSTRQLYGFLIVIDIDDKKEAVTIEDVLPYIKD